MADDAAPNAGARWEPEEDERLYDAVVRDTPQNCDPRRDQAPGPRDGVPYEFQLLDAAELIPCN